MGWGTAFNTEIYLSKQIFQHKWEVEEKIQENEKWISDCITKLKMLAIANVKDIIDPEWKEESVTWINNQVNDLMGMIEESSFENYRLNMYLDYINEKCNGEIPKRNTDDY